MIRREFWVKCGVGILGLFGIKQASANCTLVNLDLDSAYRELDRKDDLIREALLDLYAVDIEDLDDLVDCNCPRCQCIRHLCEALAGVRSDEDNGKG